MSGRRRLICRTHSSLTELFTPGRGAAGRTHDENSSSEKANLIFLFIGGRARGCEGSEAGLYFSKVYFSKMYFCKVHAAYTSSKLYSKWNLKMPIFFFSLSLSCHPLFPVNPMFDALGSLRTEGIFSRSSFLGAQFGASQSQWNNLVFYTYDNLSLKFIPKTRKSRLISSSDKKHKNIFPEIAKYLFSSPNCKI